MKKNVRRLIPFALLLLATACQHNADYSVAANTPKNIQVPTDPDMLARLDKLSAVLEAKRQEHHIPGMSIAVVKDDAVIFTKGFGQADLEKGKPATPETTYCIGSTSKAFTTGLIAMLVEEGKMSWDDPITKYIPEMKLKIDSADPNAQVTIRDMVSHQTGFARMSMLWINGGISRHDILAGASNAVPYAPFREKWYYNNVMFLGAGEAAGVAGGSSWDELIIQRVFNPLGMRQSSPSHSPRLKHQALGYRWDEDTEAYVRLPRRPLKHIGPAGSIWSNVLDMSQWLRLQLNRGTIWDKRLISEEHLTSTWEAQFEMASSMSYGMGWMLQEWEGQPVVQHGGNIDGYAAMVAMLPESNLGFVLLANVTATPLQQTVLSTVWETILGEEEAAVAENGEAEVMDFTPYEGDYMANFGNFRNVAFTVKAKDGKMAINVPGQTNYELKEPDKDGKWFFALTNTISISFEGKKGDQYNVLRMQQGGFNFELLRKDVEVEPEIDESALLKYVGTYHFKPRNMNLKAVIQNGRLALDVPGQMVFELTLPDENNRRHFRIRDELSVIFVEDESGRVTGLQRYEGDEMKETMERVVASAEDRIPTLDEIFALRRTDERKAILEQWETMRITSDVFIAQSGIHGKVVHTWRGPHYYTTTVDMGKFGNARVVANPERGSSEASFNPFERLEGKFLAQAKQSNPAMIFGDWRDYFETIEVLGIDLLEDDTKVYLISLKNEDGPTVKLFLDRTTGDVLKQESQILAKGFGSFPVTVRFEDYREVFGLRIPFRFTSSNEQTGNSISTIIHFEPGIIVPDDHFNLGSDD